MSVQMIMEPDRYGSSDSGRLDLVESYEQLFVAVSRKPNGDIAMAIKTRDAQFCKVVHIENGRQTTRRIHTMMVQPADGQVQHISGDRLPDSISLYTGMPYTGEHLAEVLLRPESAKGVPLEATSPSRSFTRDVLLVVFGFFLCRLLEFLAEEAALALSVH